MRHCGHCGSVTFSYRCPSCGWRHCPKCGEWTKRNNKCEFCGFEFGMTKKENNAGVEAVQAAHTNR